ncbi:hypothetical protein [Enterococcus sp. AZ196]|uniref:hypothetical protein n=1 Tax=Enterococcus sp. AZ196 TaxID=2774659 RepID=UPI003D28EAAA
MISKMMYRELKTKRSVSGIESVLKQNNFSVVPPTGGTCKMWGKWGEYIEVKILDMQADEILNLQEELCDYDILITRKEQLREKKRIDIFFNPESIEF